MFFFCGLTEFQMLVLANEQRKKMEVDWSRVKKTQQGRCKNVSTKPRQMENPTLNGKKSNFNI